MRHAVARWVNGAVRCQYFWAKETGIDTKATLTYRSCNRHRVVVRTRPHQAEVMAKGISSSRMRGEMPLRKAGIARATKHSGATSLFFFISISCLIQLSASFWRWFRDNSFGSTCELFQGQTPRGDRRGAVDLMQGTCFCPRYGGS
jgi:hypothetical protein